MRESPEIEALIRRLFKAVWVDHDAHTLSNLTPPASSMARMILAADDEWFLGVGSQQRDAEWSVQRAKDIGTTSVEYDVIEAYEHGDVGWFAVNAIIGRANGEPSSSRYTGILIMEDGLWRIVQWHASLGVPNAEAWGVELSKDLGHLLDSLDDSAGAAIAESSGAGTVTLLFSDVEDSTQITEAMGDADWASLIGRHLEEVRVIVEDHGGTVVKTLGDGAMAAFGSVAGALSAALDLRQRNEAAPFRIRVGLHTGDALSADGDYIGITVNKAARIASAAEPGEILLSSVTAEMAAGRHYGLGSDRTLDLKGLAGTHRVTQLESPPSEQPHP
ncbi:MAG: adenylate/guanylate cyclase domain-containing protein [Acidimicrobiia bacterium]|nr:adenylate/guanylate cyclase domain-containing protein [Acidimicrobiia bacterium]